MSEVWWGTGWTEGHGVRNKIMDFNKFDRDFNRMQKWVIRFIVTVFVLIIVSWITQIVLAVRGYNMIQTKGLKSIVHELWMGEDNL